MWVSAKDNQNIDELFQEIGKKLYINFIKNGDKGQTNISIKTIKKVPKYRCCLQKYDY